jgi:nucleoid-associated protein EbfC
MSDPQMPDMGSLFGMAMDMQQQMAHAQQALHAEVVEGQAGGGVVRVEVTGAMDFTSVTIDAEVVDPSDVEMLQDLVLAAIHDAVSQVNALQSNAMGPLGNVDLSSLDFGGTGGLDGILGLHSGAGILDDEEHDDEEHDDEEHDDEEHDDEEHDDEEHDDEEHA